MSLWIKASTKFQKLNTVYLKIHSSLWQLFYGSVFYITCLLSFICNKIFSHSRFHFNKARCNQHVHHFENVTKHCIKYLPVLKTISHDKKVFTMRNVLTYYKGLNYFRNETVFHMSACAVSVSLMNAWDGNLGSETVCSLFFEPVDTISVEPCQFVF